MQHYFGVLCSIRVTFYFAPARVASIVMRLSVRTRHASQLHQILRAADMARPFSGGVVICYVLPVLWLTLCMLSYKEPYGGVTLRQQYK